MTMPHLMNCAHSADGWCLDCVGHLHAEAERLRALLSEPSAGFTHQCISCHQRYNPPQLGSEDCPRCGCDGKTRAAEANT